MKLWRGNLLELAVDSVDSWSQDRKIGSRGRRMGRDEPMVLLLAASSFVEAASHVYSCNLAAHFAGDDEVSEWLEKQWEPQETQHGRMLRTYADYSTRCSLQRLEPARGLEMVARCVVEMGTATLYRAIRDCAEDPALKRLADKISLDELSHYRHFRSYFKKYHREEHYSRLQVLSVLVRRTIELKLEDAECGLRHAIEQRYPARRHDATFAREMRARVAGLVRAHYPFDMAGKMLLKPLQLPLSLEGFVRFPLVVLGRCIALR
jgi:hypothetical protein